MRKLDNAEELHLDNSVVVDENQTVKKIEKQENLNSGPKKGVILSPNSASSYNTSKLIKMYDNIM